MEFFIIADYKIGEAQLTELLTVDNPAEICDSIARPDHQPDFLALIETWVDGWKRGLESELAPRTS